MRTLLLLALLTVSAVVRAESGPALAALADWRTVSALRAEGAEKEIVNPARFRERRAGLTIVVPDDVKSIGAALALAAEGDTIRVKPGSYREQLLLKSGVRVVGDDVLQCRLLPPADAAAVVLAADCREAVLENFTISGEGHDSRRMYGFGFDWKPGGEDSRPRVAALTGVEDDRVRPGLAVAGVTEAAMEQAIYLLAAAGRSVEAPIRLQKEDGEVLELALPTMRVRVDGVWPDGMAVFQSTVSIVNCRFVNLPGCGLLADGAGTRVAVKDCRFDRTGCGLIVQHRAAAAVTGGRFTQNRLAGLLAHGAGVRAQVAESRFLQNVGTGLIGAAAAQLEVAACRSVDNTASGLIAAGADAVVKESVFSGNNYTGVTFRDGATGSIRNCELRDNFVGLEIHESPKVIGADNLIEDRK